MFAKIEIAAGLYICNAFPLHANNSIFACKFVTSDELLITSVIVESHPFNSSSDTPGQKIELPSWFMMDIRI